MGTASGIKFRRKKIQNSVATSIGILSKRGTVHHHSARHVWRHQTYVNRSCSIWSARSEPRFDSALVAVVFFNEIALVETGDDRFVDWLQLLFDWHGANVEHPRVAGVYDPATHVFEIRQSFFRGLCEVLAHFVAQVRPVGRKRRIRKIAERF